MARRPREKERVSMWRAPALTAVVGAILLGVMSWYMFIGPGSQVPPPEPTPVPTPVGPQWMLIEHPLHHANPAPTAELCNLTGQFGGSYFVIAGGVQGSVKGSCKPSEAMAEITWEVLPGGGTKDSLIPVHLLKVFTSNNPVPTVKFIWNGDISGVPSQVPDENRYVQSNQLAAVYVYISDTAKANEPALRNF